MKLRMNQMNLAEVWLAGIARDARTMLDGNALMRVAVHAEACDEENARLIRLGETMSRAARHAHDAPRQDDTRIVLRGASSSRSSSSPGASCLNASLSMK